MDLERYFEDLSFRFGGIPSLSADSKQEIVDALEGAWLGRQSKDLPVISRWAAAFLGCPEISSVIWHWIVSKARVADDQEKTSLVVGIFELLAEPPKEDKYLQLLFSLLKEPELNWIFLDIYELQPSQLYEDLKRVVKMADRVEPNDI